jgi:hypothetical protein
VLPKNITGGASFVVTITPHTGGQSNYYARGVGDSWCGREPYNGDVRSGCRP